MCFYMSAFFVSFQDDDVEEDYFESEGGSQSSRSRSSLWGHLKGVSARGDGTMRC